MVYIIAKTYTRPRALIVINVGVTFIGIFLNWFDLIRAY